MQEFAEEQRKAKQQREKDYRVERDSSLLSRFDRKLVVHGDSWYIAYKQMDGYGQIELSSWEWFGTLLSWAKAAWWWNDFVMCQQRPGSFLPTPDSYDGLLPVDLVDPDALADALYAFLNSYQSQ